eukprot:6401946-Prymnesium_polylepis.2
MKTTSSSTFDVGGGAASRWSLASSIAREASRDAAMSAEKHAAFRRPEKPRQRACSLSAARLVRRASSRPISRALSALRKMACSVRMAISRRVAHAAAALRRCTLCSALAARKRDSRSFSALRNMACR